MYYNFFRPHESLKGKTPAQAGKIKYDVKDWAGLVRLPVPIIRISDTREPLLKPPKTIIDTSKLMKRVRGHRIPKEVNLGSGIVRSHGRQHISLVAPHYTRRGGGITRRSDI